VSYTTQAQGGETKAPSLLGDTAELRQRLEQIRQRVSKVADSLHGPEPSPVGKDLPPEPSPTVHRNLNHCHATASDIERELQRVESRL
jgi:hypothetical protein